MPGYFSVSAAAQLEFGTYTVVVTISSVDGFKGTVQMTYSYDPTYDTPNSIIPTSANLYVPHNGSVQQSVLLNIDANQDVRFIASGVSGSLTSSDEVDINT